MASCVAVLILGCFRTQFEFERSVSADWFTRGSLKRLTLKLPHSARSHDPMCGIPVRLEARRKHSKLEAGFSEVTVGLYRSLESHFPSMSVPDRRNDLSSIGESAKQGYAI